MREQQWAERRRDDDVEEEGRTVRGSDWSPIGERQGSKVTFVLCIQFNSLVLDRHESERER